MTPEQYAAAQAAITAGLASYVQRFTSLFTSAALSQVEWLKLLQVLFPEVQRRYAEAAALGRDFYDSQRRLHHPELPRNERLLSELRFEWFVKNMEPARRGMSQAGSPQKAVTRVTLTAVREVEMAGRRQIIGSVKHDEELSRLIAQRKSTPAPTVSGTIRLPPPSSDPAEDEPTLVQGWARVATGRETCAWCLMLISRGPDYTGAGSAGLGLDDETAIDLFNEAGGDLKKFRKATKKHVEEWHVGCDCLVVPVFNKENWPGKSAQKKALQLWIDAGKEASQLIRDGKARTDNENLETQNALRRRLYRGEISMSDYALAA